MNLSAYFKYRLYLLFCLPDLTYYFAEYNSIYVYIYIQTLFLQSIYSDIICTSTAQLATILIKIIFTD